MTENKIITIGRNPDNNIIIDCPEVSRFHAKIIKDNGNYIIKDLESRHGIFINNKRCTSSNINFDDEIRLGPYYIFDMNQLKISDKTKKFKNSGHAIKAEKINLDKDINIIRIGRDKNNDIILDYPQISGNHAMFKKKNGKYTIYDLQSTNGTFVNGKRIKNCVIRDHDKILLGSVLLEIDDDGTIQRYDNRDGVYLDAVKLVQQKGDKRYLNNVSFSILPKEFVGLLGPSGAGKTTLLDTIMGLRKATSGQVFINNISLYENFDAFRQSIGYVPQDDIIHTQLTVRQCLYYTAKLRLALDDDAEINRCIDNVLQELELTKIQNSQIEGNKEKISGGQRKRVNLAVELLANPRLLFIDEPTNGLDPRVERLMMKLFRKLANNGRSIIVTTHNLSSLDQLDNIVFLSEGGSLSYYGPAEDCNSYFNTKATQDIYEHLTEEKALEKNLQYQHSPYNQKFVEKRLNNLNYHKSNNSNQMKQTNTKIFDNKQAMILLLRNFAIKMNDVRNTLTVFAQALIIACLISIGFEQVNVSLLLIISLSAYSFGCINSCREIVGEISIYKRERMVNLNIFSYIASKFILMILFCFIQGISFLSIIYYNVDMGPNSMLFMFIVFLFTSVGGIFTGLFISSVVDNQDRANYYVPIVLLPQIIFAGVLFKLEGLSAYISYLTISKWSLKAFQNQEVFINLSVITCISLLLLLLTVLTLSRYDINNVNIVQRFSKLFSK